MYTNINVTIEKWISINGIKHKAGKTKVVPVKRKSGSELKFNVY